MKIYKIGFLLTALLVQLIVFSDGLIADSCPPDFYIYDELVVNHIPDIQKQQNCKVLYIRNYFSNPVYFSNHYSPRFKLLVAHEILKIKGEKSAKETCQLLPIPFLLPRSILRYSIDELIV